MLFVENSRGELKRSSLDGCKVKKQNINFSAEKRVWERKKVFFVVVVSWLSIIKSDCQNNCFLFSGVGGGGGGRRGSFCFKSLVMFIVSLAADLIVALVPRDLLTLLATVNGLVTSLAHERRLIRAATRRADLCLARGDNLTCVG